MSAIILFLLHTLLVSKCAVIWEDTFELRNYAYPLPNYLNWTVGANPVGSIVYPPDVTVSLCPNAAYCWEFTQDYYAFYVHSTSNYNNIALTVSISQDGLESSDSCNIYYSIDASTTNWTSIATWTNADTLPITQIIPLPTNSADNAGVGIKLQSESAATGNKDDNCYFSDIILEGDIINVATSPPTTTEPTASQASTNTAKPTTSDPTSNPTQPTAPTAPTEPTTSNPTISNPTKAPNIGDTDAQGDDDDNEDGESNAKDSKGTGGLIGGIAAAAGCFIIIFCVIVFVRKKTKNDKEDDTRKKMEANVTATYLDVYTGGTGSTPIPKEEPATTTTNLADPAPKITQEDFTGTGPAPPMELTQIFGPTQAEKIKNNDSDSDSLLKKQAYFDKQENN